jgi:23S rRNA pseudouridine2605 synthase
MEENVNGGQEHQEERSDYAQNDTPKSGYSSEGRKLRPRRKVSPVASSSEEREHRPYGRSYREEGYESENHGGSYGERRGYHDREDRGGYGSRRNYGDRPSYGNNRERGERRSYGQSRPSYGSRRSYGDRPANGEGRPSYREGRPSYGPRRSYGDRPANGEGRPSYREGRPSYGPRRSYGDRPANGERRPSYREGRPSYGPRRSYGDRPNYGDGQEGGERRPYSRRPSGDRNFSYKPGFSRSPARPGARRFNRGNEAYFTETDEAGINRMLSRKPQIDSTAYSDNDMVPTPIQEEVRLNKFIANSGICSRREADNYIQAGVVTVNGEVVTQLGTKVNILKDEVRFNGERLKGEEKVYIVMNKPKGFVTTASDPHAEKTVMNLLKGCELRVFPVGRLDKNTTGVLMFTNDGEIAEQLTHPSYNKKKIYQVILDKPLEVADKDKILAEGLELNDGNIKADELEYIDAEDHRRLGIEIHSGKNRIVRRIFESLGYDVKALDRVYFAGLTKKGLKKGEWRYLSEGEVNILKMGAYV